MKVVKSGCCPATVAERSAVAVSIPKSENSAAAEAGGAAAADRGGTSAPGPLAPLLFACVSFSAVATAEENRARMCLCPYLPLRWFREQRLPFLAPASLAAFWRWQRCLRW